MNKKRRFGMSIGSVSLILVFAVLCLALFASLTLISAKNEMTLTAKSADFTTQYYEAESQAAQKLQQIDTILSNAAQKSSRPAAEQFIESQCAEYDFKYTQINNNIYITFNEDINSMQSLHITLKINSITDISYEILQWKKININQVNIDDSINVYK